jgi:hypothetical protein
LSLVVDGKRNVSGFGMSKSAERHGAPRGRLHVQMIEILRVVAKFGLRF